MIWLIGWHAVGSHWRGGRDISEVSSNDHLSRIWWRWMKGRLLYFVLCSNSSWIASDVPSITYGLRGVVHCAIEVRNYSLLHISSLIRSPSMFRSHQNPRKTAIPVSTVVGGTNQCGTCERFSPRKVPTVNVFSQGSGSRGTHRPQPQRAHPKFLCEINFSPPFLQVRHTDQPINLIPALQATKCAHSMKKRRVFSTC